MDHYSSRENVLGIRKKVGIVTYHRAINYGALLQVFALQQVIEKLGMQSTVLDYRNQKIEDMYKRIKFNTCSSITDYAKFFLMANNYNKKYDRFRSFSHQYLTMSEPIYTKRDLESLQNEFDYFLTGSDQVWNTYMNDNDYTYFLDFVTDKRKKKSYAASFGFEIIPNGYENKYFNLLTDFDSFLVREKQGAKIIFDLLGRDSQVVLDPTMLLEKKDWLELINLKKEGGNNENYILVYGFGFPDNMRASVLKLSQETGLKIRWLATTHRISRKIEYLKHDGPIEFLSQLINAKYIITNSFHGTALSIVFNKQFYTNMLPDSYKVNSRLINILGLFDLEDRLITTDCVSNLEYIDYPIINEKVKKARLESIALLKNSLP